MSFIMRKQHYYCKVAEQPGSYLPRGRILSKGSPLLPVACEWGSGVMQVRWQLSGTRPGEGTYLPASKPEQREDTHTREP